MTNEITRMQQLAGIELNELNVNDPHNRKINISDTLNHSNILKYFKRYNLDLYDGNLISFLDNHLKYYINYSYSDLVDEFKVYLDDN